MNFLIRLLNEAISGILIIAGFTAIMVVWIFFCIWYAANLT